jgi:K+-sensing histidine kinase KdpD
MVFLGAAAGVGKTFAMLGEARADRAERRQPGIAARAHALANAR